jgi:catecholate siderophore receptor
LGAIAQDASTPSYLPSSGETVQLDKFVVTGRREVASYVIKQTVTGTKTDTPLVNVPQSMTVITRELIDDQGMRGMVDLARYVPGTHANRFCRTWGVARPLGAVHRD